MTSNRAIPLEKWRDPRSGPPLASAARHEEVRKLMAKEGYHVPGYELDDLVAATCLVMARRYRMPSAFDPRKSSFGHYVHIVARHTCAKLSQSRGRQVVVLGADVV